MKKQISLFLSVICLIVLAGCFGSPSNPQASEVSTSSTQTFSVSAEQSSKTDPTTPGTQEETPNSTIPKVTVQIGDKSFSVTLYDNESVRAFAEKLPLTLNMEELNGNEKFYFFPEKFPSNSERIGNIKAGDLMLYGSDCLVLFYESFSTSYSYTRLGYVEDVSGLADALGSGSVEVTFNINSTLQNAENTHYRRKFTLADGAF
ncbi:cyclophilin-like fold protein [Lacrimispora sp.]|uniref:cyclophilin-like fold protein n=1 Tax=Lacrimispora sp. TaxID=2719234 RepID=UPI003460FD39